MAAKAVDNIFKILESEKTMEARKNVAAEISIYSSSMIDDCRVQIGANSKAMPTLVELFKESTPIGKRDDDTALGLSMQNPQELIFHLSSNHQERLTTVQEAQICIQNI
jgi:threonine dehydratase